MYNLSSFCLFDCDQDIVSWLDEEHGWRDIDLVAMDGWLEMDKEEQIISMQAHNVYLEKVAMGGWTRNTGGNGEGNWRLPVQVNKNMITMS